MIDRPEERPAEIAPGDISDDAIRDAVIRGDLPAQLPKDFKAEREGASVRLRIVDSNKLVTRSGSVTYVFSHAGDVDTSTKDGLDAGLARGVGCGSVSAPGEEDAESTYLVSDTRYGSGHSMSPIT